MINLNPCPMCGRSVSHTITVGDLICFRGKLPNCQPPSYRSGLICKDNTTNKVLFDSRLNIRPRNIANYVIDKMWAEIVPCTKISKFVVIHEAVLVCLVHDPNEKGEANEKIAERPV